MRARDRILIACLVGLVLAAGAIIQWITHPGERVSGSGVPDQIVAVRPLSPDALRRRGRLRLGLSRGTLSFFIDRGAPRGFEYELVRRFARRHGARLDIALFDGPEPAAARLHDRDVDVAVLPWIGVEIDGAERTVPYLRPGLRADDTVPAFPETGALYVRNDSPGLLDEMNRFLVQTMTSGTGTMLFRRYFERIKDSRPDAVNAPELSPYDDLIARHAQSAGLDWRFVAALMLEESRFDPNAVSHKGALGLLQVMPIAAPDVRAKDLLDPEANVRAGTRHLRRISQMFPESEGEDHLAIVLAAYLMGPGHVFDAQAIAIERKLDPHRWWGHLEKVMPDLEDEEIASRTTHGFARGELATRYVDSVLDRYRLYRQHTD